MSPKTTPRAPKTSAAWAGVRVLREVLASVLSGAHPTDRVANPALHRIYMPPGEILMRP